MLEVPRKLVYRVRRWPRGVTLGLENPEVLVARRVAALRGL